MYFLSRGLYAYGVEEGVVEGYSRLSRPRDVMLCHTVLFPRLACFNFPAFLFVLLHRDFHPTSRQTLHNREYTVFNRLFPQPCYTVLSSLQ